MNKAKIDEVSERVSGYTLRMVEELVHCANGLEGIGFKRQAYKLRKMAGELENVTCSIAERGYMHK